MRDAPGRGPVVVIDNYDSFTYNLVQYVGELGEAVEVYRNDRVGVEQVLERRPLAVIISPGPGRPEQAGITMPLIRRALPELPLLGVCLGHQALGAVLGGKVVQAPSLLHGKASWVRHDGRTIFQGLPNPLRAGRYHSLCIDPDSVPAELEVSAVDEEGCIMAVRHRHYPAEGVQFHPESVLTPEGKQLLGNFLELARAWWANRRAQAAEGVRA